MEEKNLYPLTCEFVSMLTNRFKDQAHHIDAFIIGYLTSFIANHAEAHPDIEQMIRDRMQLMQDNPV